MEPHVIQVTAVMQNQSSEALDNRRVTRPDTGHIRYIQCDLSCSFSRTFGVRILVPNCQNTPGAEEREKTSWDVATNLLDKSFTEVLNAVA